MKKVLVCGAGGFIGHHLVSKLKEEGFWVRGVDLKHPEFEKTNADEFIVGDLRDYDTCKKVTSGGIQDIYQLAADMGGAGFIFTGENDADIMHNSAQINLNIAKFCELHKIQRVLYTSSACIYPEHNQMDPNNPVCSEQSAYPANPDSEYGWEKLFGERLYMSFARNKNYTAKIARLHNVFGPMGTWQGGREKAPAAICRKVAEASLGKTNEVEIWGSGKQTRSFLYIEECITGLRKLMESDFNGPVNVGSEEMISINDLAKLVMNIAGVSVPIKNVKGPAGVNGRNSDNNLIRQKLKWSPTKELSYGIKNTYDWILAELSKANQNKKAA